MVVFQDCRVSFDFLVSSLITLALEIEMQEPHGCLTGISNQYLQNPSEWVLYHPFCDILSELCLAKPFLRLGKKYWRYLSSSHKRLWFYILHNSWLCLLLVIPMSIILYYSINNTTIFNCIILILYSSCKLLYQNSYFESSVIQYISCTSFRVIWKYKFNSLLTVSSFSLGIKLKLILFTRKFIIRQALFVYPSNCVH